MQRWCSAPGPARTASMAVRPATACSPTATWPCNCRTRYAGCPKGCLRAHNSPNFQRPEKNGRLLRPRCPPLERHIAEGSFFIDDDKTLLQVQQGEGVPVTH